MKRKLVNILLVLLFILAIPGTMALASDISGALYKMTIQVSNNGTLANYVASNCTGISAQNLIDGGYMTAAGNTTAMVDSSGNDVAFMPGYSTNPWALYVETIGSNSYLEYYFYTAYCTGGNVVYFPGIAGMEVDDNASLEPADDFEIEVTGYLDAESIGSDVFSKADAIRCYISAANTITVSVPDIAGAGVPTTQDYDPTASGTFQENTLTGATRYGAMGDDSDATYLRNATSNYFTDTFTNNAIFTDRNGEVIDSITVFWRAKEGGANCDGYAELYIDGNEYVSGVIEEYTNAFAWYSYEWTTNPDTAAAWEIADLNGIEWGFTHREKPAGGSNADTSECYLQVSYYPPVEVSAINVTSDEHTVTVSADTVDLEISIDGAVAGDYYDSAALGGVSVDDNGNDWYFCKDGAVVYMYDASVDVGGAPVSAWEWEYGATFEDSIGANDATPAFLTASSDADVTAEAVAFAPVAEAKAPAWVLDLSTATWITAANITGNFTTTPTPTFPGEAVIEDIAAASGTPAQLPFTVLACFLTLAISLVVSSVMRDNGSRSLLVKFIVIGGLMGIGEALQVVDFWMLLFFLIMGLAIMAASKQGQVI